MGAWHGGARSNVRRACTPRVPRGTQGDPGVEELFVLRLPPALAAKAHAALSERGGQERVLPNSELRLAANGGEGASHGSLVWEGDEYAATLQDLPCVVEAWKTYNDADLVKSGDVGQVIVVQESGADPPKDGECRHGVTNATTNIRRRRFRKALGGGADATHAQRTAHRRTIRAVQNDVQDILQGGLPSSVKVEILEEEVPIEEEEGADAVADADGKAALAEADAPLAAVAGGGAGGSGGGAGPSGTQ